MKMLQRILFTRAKRAINGLSPLDRRTARHSPRKNEWKARIRADVGGDLSTAEETLLERTSRQLHLEPSVGFGESAASMSCVACAPWISRRARIRVSRAENSPRRLPCRRPTADRKSTRLNSSHLGISY